MADQRYAEMAAVPALWTPPIPKPNSKITRENMAVLGGRWCAAYPDNKEARIFLATRLLGDEFSKEEFQRMAPTIKALLDLEHQ